MAKKIAVEDRLAGLSALDLKDPASLDSLRTALEDKSNLVVARAASLAAKGDLRDLTPELEESWNRLMSAGTSADKGCPAKTALAKALYQFGTGSEELFLTGVHHVQLEPVFGGTADTARELRGICAMGLVRVGYRDAMTEITDLLGDPEQQARVMAARALAYSGREEAALPLRMKVLCGDAVSEVIAECFAALMQLAPSKSTRFVARFLESTDEDLAAEAAMALGSARSEQAAAILLEHWRNHPHQASRERLVVPLAMLRRPESLAFLLEVIRESPETLACAAADAMGMYRSDAAIHEQVISAARVRGGAVLAAARKALN